ncbi:monooxygenase 2-like, partial [Rutidosis leptorrhynchoides]|uniref:monooxygenase 2-like n=1 Tax=Rutidosis leptorrhynchoides TaxID=125765 RepID=UPI003A999D04
MEVVAYEDVVIVGAGIASLTTALGLHRLGIRSLVLESSENLRVTGFVFETWDNAWKALDTVGVGEHLHYQLDGTIRFSSKVVAIEDSGFFKLVHLVVGTVVKAKVLIGCDGLNSVVAKYMGFNKPAFSGRSAVRGYALFEEDHGFGCKFYQLFGSGIRSGFMLCDDKTVYWFLTWSPSSEVASVALGVEIEGFWAAIKIWWLYYLSS